MYPSVLLPRAQYFVRVSNARGDNYIVSLIRHTLTFREYRAHKDIPAAKFILVRFEPLFEEHFPVLIKGEVYQSMTDPQYWGSESAEQRPNSFFSPDFHDRVEYALVHALIMFLRRWPEYFCLHARAHHPKGIGDYVAKKSWYTRTHRIQLERVVSPAVLSLEMLFSLFVEGKVDGVEEGNAKNRDRVT